MATFQEPGIERTSSTNLRTEIDEDEIVLFLRAALDEGGRILIERTGNVYELYESSGGALRIRLVGPDSGA